MTSRAFSICLVADALRVVARVGNELVGALLGNDEHAGNLALGRRDVVLRHGRGGNGRDLHALGGGAKLLLEAGDLRLRSRELLLGGVQAALEVCDLLQHRVNLIGNLLEEGVDLLGVVAVLRGREGLLLDICWCDCHLCPFHFDSSPRALPAKRQ